MASDYVKIKKGANVEPLASSVTTKGDIGYNSATDKLELYNGAVDPLVNEAKAATLTNKTLTSPAINGGTNDSATITNASIITNSIFKDVVDNTKHFQISSSANTAGTKMTLSSATTANRILTLPDATDTLVSRTSTDTLTNKTLSGNTASNLINGAATFNFNSTGTITTPNATDTLVGKATTDILTNKTLSGNTATNLISGAGTFTFNTTGTVTVPNGTDTLVARTSTDTLTNKTMGDALTFTQIATPSNPASGFNKLYPKSNNLFYTLDSTGAERAVGSGTGSINYIANPDAEGGTTGWATYADAAGSQPVNGTGGSPTETYTRTTSSPLRGTGSFLLTKDAANRQGEGASYDFTIDSADQAKPIYVSFDYAIASGTYADGDLTVYLYDVTNALVIQAIPYQILNATTGLSQRWIGYFQSSAASTSYRLIIHTASTSALAYTVKFDNFVTGPSQQFIGAIVTDWTSYTPTFTGFGTATAIEFYYRRNGDTLEVTGNWTTGTVSGTEARVSFPSGLTSFAFPSLRLAGERSAAEDDGFATNTVLVEPSVTYFTFGRGATGFQQLVKQNGNIITNTGVKQSIFAKVPVAGWSSNVNMSATLRTAPTTQKLTSGSAATYTTPNGVKYLRVRLVGGGGGGGGGAVAAASGAGGTGGSTTFAGGGLTLTGVGGAGGAGNDVGGAGGTGTISAGSGLIFPGQGGGCAGFVTAVNTFQGANGPGGSSMLGGGAAGQGTGNAAGTAGVANSGGGGSGAGAPNANNGRGGSAGGGGGGVDFVINNPSATYTYTIGAGGTAGTAGTSGSAGGAGGTGLIIVEEYYANEGGIAASEKVYLTYTNNGGNSITADVTNITWSTKVVDSHAAWSTNIFTAPKAAFYLFQGQDFFTTNIGGSADLYINGVKKFASSFESANTTIFGFSYAWYMNAGDTASIRSSATGTLSNSATFHYINISSQG